jgi:hypothetical protein
MQKQEWQPIIIPFHPFEKGIGSFSVRSFSGGIDPCPRYRMISIFTDSSPHAHPDGSSESFI